MEEKQYKNKLFYCRSIGLTGESCNLRLFLIGVCDQMQRIADANKEETNEDEEKYRKNSVMQDQTPLRDLDFKQLSFKFNQLLLKCASKRTPLFIFIDNLDAIPCEHDAKQFKWIPAELPPHVKLVVTMTAEDTNGIKSTVRKPGPFSRSESLQQIKTTKSQNNRFCFAKMQSSECLCSIKKRCLLDESSLSTSGNIRFIPKFKLYNSGDLPLKSTSIEKIVLKMLKRENCDLSSTQITAVVDSCSLCPNPLAAAISVAISHDWTSCKKSEECRDDLPLQADSIEAFVNCYFRHLESRHGRPLVGAVSSYITLSLNGLTTNELLTLLSFDKNISKWLADLTITEAKSKNKNNQKAKKGTTAKAHKIKNALRQTRTKEFEAFTHKNLPEMLWQNLRSDLDFFMMETLSDGKLTLRWKNVIFGSVSLKR